MFRDQRLPRIAFSGGGIGGQITRAPGKIRLNISACQVLNKFPGGSFPIFAMVKHHQAAARYRGARGSIGVHPGISGDAQLKAVPDTGQQRSHAGGRAGHDQLPAGHKLIGGTTAVDQRAGGVQILPSVQESNQRTVLNAGQGLGRTLGAVMAVHQIAAHLAQPIGQRGRIGHGGVDRDVIAAQHAQRADIGQGFGRRKTGGIQRGPVIIGHRGGRGKGQTQLSSLQPPVGHGRSQHAAEINFRVIRQQRVHRIGVFGGSKGNLAGGIHLQHIGQGVALTVAQHTVHFGNSFGIGALVDGLDLNPFPCANRFIKLFYIFGDQPAGIIGHGMPEDKALGFSLGAGADTSHHRPYKQQGKHTFLH